MDLYLRTATSDDLPLMMAWRSNPIIYAGFFQQLEPLRWEEHLSWFQGRPSSWRTFIILYEERPVGVVTVGQLEHWTPEIGYYVGETTLWGKGIGRQAVKLVLEWLRNKGKEYCHTTVKKDNKRSINMLKALGFEYMAEGRKNEIWMQRIL